MERILVTGGAGFIGANFVIGQLRKPDTVVVNLDALTYAGNLDNLRDVADSPRHVFIQGDVCDADLVNTLLTTHRPSAIIHFAAESHVDRSIDGPAPFIETNVDGTFTLLDCARRYWEGLEGGEREAFRFVHVSTDEVYGSLGVEGYFHEGSPYRPNSPYAASKAASDHLVQAWSRTYGFPAMITHCGNNYGPFQFPEKLIPHMISRALERLPLPIYGDGRNVRDWIYVGDHCTALEAVWKRGQPGETYNIGAGCELENLELVRMLCRMLDELQPSTSPYEELISFVPDRPGHDRRYAIDAARVRGELGWQPSLSFEAGLRRTIEWYLGNAAWCERITAGTYRLQRLGLQQGVNS